MADAYLSDSAYDDGESLADYRRHALRTGEMRTFSAVPCTVARVREAAGKPLCVDVDLHFVGVYVDVSTRREVERKYPTVPSCPVGHVASAGFRAGVRPAVGDHGWLVVSTVALERWYRADGRPVDPGMGSRQRLGAGLFLPMGGPGPNAPTFGDDFEIVTEAGNGVSITPAGDVSVDGAQTVTVSGAQSVTVSSSSEVVVDAPVVRVGGSGAVQSIAIAEQVLAAVDAAVTAAMAATPPSPDTGVARFTAFQTAWNAAKNTIAAARGKVL